MKAGADLSDAFTSLIGEYERLIQKVAGLYAADAEDRKDLTSEIVLQLWRAYPRFRGAAKESTWLYRVALNTAITRQRSDMRKPPLSFDETLSFDIPDMDDTTDADVRRLHSAITALPQLERALTLLHLEDRSHAEIAEIMGISVSNVGTRLSRIREKLRKLMAN